MALQVIASWERGTNTLDYLLQGAFQRSKLSPQDKDHRIKPELLNGSITGDVVGGRRVTCWRIN